MEKTTAQALAELTKRSTEAEGILEKIRKVAAEQGVSQQAIYFKGNLR
jgi:hypothetical protein